MKKKNTKAIVFLVIGIVVSVYCLQTAFISAMMMMMDTMSGAPVSMPLVLVLVMQAVVGITLFVSSIVHYKKAQKKCKQQQEQVLKTEETAATRSHRAGAQMQQSITIQPQLPATYFVQLESIGPNELLAEVESLKTALSTTDDAETQFKWMAAVLSHGKFFDASDCEKAIEISRKLRGSAFFDTLSSEEKAFVCCAASAFGAEGTQTEADEKAMKDACRYALETIQNSVVTSQALVAVLGMAIGSALQDEYYGIYSLSDIGLIAQTALAYYDAKHGAFAFLDENMLKSFVGFGLSAWCLDDAQPKNALLTKYATQFLKSSIDELCTVYLSEPDSESTKVDASVGNRVLRETPTQTASEPSPKSRKTTKLPDLNWFAQNGMPVQEVPIEKRLLKKLSGEERQVIAFATFALLKRRILIMALLVVALVGVVVSTFISAGVGTGAMVLAIAFLGGSFFINKPANLLYGFQKIGGFGLFAWPIALLLGVLSTLLSIWGSISNMILMLFNRNNQSAVRSQLRVGMPQNCEFDQLIAVYSRWEAQAIAADNQAERIREAEEDARKNLRKSQELEYMQQKYNKMDADKIGKALSTENAVQESAQALHDLQAKYNAAESEYDKRQLLTEIEQLQEKNKKEMDENHKA